MAEFDRHVIEAAATYMADEDAGGVGFLYSGWCQAALPHRKLSDERGWVIRSDHVALVVQPGMRVDPDGEAVSIGVPYGSRARLIMLYLKARPCEPETGK